MPTCRRRHSPIVSTHSGPCDRFPHNHCYLQITNNMEPKEWFDTTDSPTALPSSIRTLVACGNNYGFLDDDEISIHVGDIYIDRFFEG